MPRSTTEATMVEQSPLMSVAEVARYTTFSRTQIFKLRAQGLFPRAIPLGEKRIAFLRSEIEAWLRERIQARDEAIDADDQAGEVFEEIRKITSNTIGLVDREMAAGCDVSNEAEA
jgi:prophage regulatory protein